MKVKVRNMVSPQTGNEVANQFIIEVGNKTYFQSYDSIIAMEEKKEDKAPVLFLDSSYWDYSVTTLKYLKEFMGTSLSKKEIQKRIDCKEIKTKSLN